MSTLVDDFIDNIVYSINKALSRSGLPSITDARELKFRERIKNNLDRNNLLISTEFEIPFSDEELAPFIRIFKPISDVLKNATFKEELTQAKLNGYAKSINEKITSLYENIRDILTRNQADIERAKLRVKKTKISIEELDEIKKVKDKIKEINDLILLKQEEIILIKDERKEGFRLEIVAIEQEINGLENIKKELFNKIRDINEAEYRKAKEEEKKKLEKVRLEERERSKFKLESRRKYKIMSKQSNDLAREIQKTIERVAAQGFNGGEAQYQGRGMKKKVVKKRKPQKKVQKGGKFFEDPADEVSYILERLSEMIREGDVQHIDLVAKKLRKAKRIGKGKYYIFDEEYEGGMLEGGRRKKVQKGKRPMSSKQEAWLKFVKKVHKEYPELTYKEAMMKASELKNQM